MTTARQISRVELLERVARLPREHVAHLPTPLEPAPRLQAALGSGAPKILIKRDDMTGLALGGNKVRHLDFRLGDIRAKGCDTIIVTNVAQSNHARLHAALAAKYGMTTYILKIPSRKDEPVNGNLLLDHIVGAKIVEASSADQEIVDRELDSLVERLEGEGRTVYVAPRDSFSKIAGVCSYLVATVELLDQLDATDQRVDHIYLAAGASSAGLALGGKLLGAPYRVHPVSVGESQSAVEAYVCTLANNAASHLGFDISIGADDISVHDQYVGEAYGVPTSAGMEALSLAGKCEGLILDPVYTAKALSALIDHTRTGRIGAGETAVFVHTGGLPITFAYAEEILAAKTG